MSNIIGSVSLQLGLSIISILIYFIYLRKYLKTFINELENFKKKKSDILDSEFLENKIMKTKDFLKYHTKIHEIDDTFDKAYDNANWSMIAGFALIILLPIDTLFDYLRGWIWGYPFQNIIWLLCAIAFIVLVINYIDVWLFRRREMKK